MELYQSEMPEKGEKPSQEGDPQGQDAPQNIQLQPQTPQEPQTPQSPQNGKNPKPEKTIEQQVHSAQNFILAGSIVGLVGWIAGGLLIAIVGLVLSIVGLRKEKAVEKANPSLAPQLKQLRHSGYSSIIICATAIIYTIVLAVLWYPYISEFIETGDIESLYTDMGSVEEMENAPTTTWG